MINDSWIDTFASNAGAHNGNISTDDGFNYAFILLNYISVLFDFTILICIFGILGNGMVIWLLGFHIKRSPFTTFILNLAVADSGVLISTIMYNIGYFSPFLYILNKFSFYAFCCMSITSQMFLTVTSVDRCVSVFFSLWHRCHQPKWLSTLVCAVVWLLSSLTTMTEFILYKTGTGVDSDVVIYLLIPNAFLCIPLMTISSLMLFLKVCCKLKQQRRQKLLTTMLVTVAFFLLCSLPFNTFMCIYYLGGEYYYYFLHGAMFFACLNSSIHPLIYYLVGRRKEGHSNKSMKGVLQNLFKEEEI